MKQNHDIALFVSRLTFISMYIIGAWNAESIKFILLTTLFLIYWVASWKYESAINNVIAECERR